MRKLFGFTLLASALMFASCGTTRSTSGRKDDRKIEVVFVQVNDVYEIAPLSGGKEGGMARVATIKKKYQQQNKNTFLVMSGDFLSPSVYNSLRFEDKAIRGKQMVEAMNAAAMDVAVFGNHEFDIKESELQERINESSFRWVSSNTFHNEKGKVGPFIKDSKEAFPRTLILNVSDKDGTTAKVGLIGITLPANRAEYVTYTDPLSTAKEAYNQLKDSVDAVVAITHQAVEDDVQLAKELPNLALILGGHEHDMRFKKEGSVYITKAHANAKSAYIVKLAINKKKGKIKADPELEYINESVPFDSATNAVVEKWMRIAENNYSSLGFDARKVILSKGEALNGIDADVRSMPTNFTRIIVEAMKEAAPQADVILLNGGSIRVDDMLTMPVTQYDILRGLPFGGGIREVEMKGSLLSKVLTQGRKNRGNGGFLHYNENLVYDEPANVWKQNGVAIDPARIYRVAMSDFLLTGKETALDYLNPQNPDITKTYEAATAVADSRSDIRLALVRYLEKRNK